METAAISERRNARKCRRRTKPVSLSTTKLIAVPAKVRRTPHAPKHKSNAVSMRNPLYAPKLNMFLLWLSCSFVSERRDTEGCKSKSQK